MLLIWQGSIIHQKPLQLLDMVFGYIHTHTAESETWLSLHSKQVRKTQNPFQSKVLHPAGFQCTGAKKGRRNPVDPHHQRLRNHTALFGNYLQSAPKHHIKKRLQVSKLRQIRLHSMQGDERPQNPAALTFWTFSCLYFPHAPRCKTKVLKC